MMRNHARRNSGNSGFTPNSVTPSPMNTPGQGGTFSSGFPSLPPAVQHGLMSTTHRTCDILSSNDSVCSSVRRRRRRNRPGMLQQPDLLIFSSPMSPMQLPPASERPVTPGKNRRCGVSHKLRSSGAGQPYKKNRDRRFGANNSNNSSRQDSGSMSNYNSSAFDMEVMAHALHEDGAFNTSSAGSGNQHPFYGRSRRDPTQPRYMSLANIHKKSRTAPTNVRLELTSAMESTDIQSQRSNRFSGGGVGFQRAGNNNHSQQHYGNRGAGGGRNPQFFELMCVEETYEVMEDVEVECLEIEEHHSYGGNNNHPRQGNGGGFNNRRNSNSNKNRGRGGANKAPWGVSSTAHISSPPDDMQQAPKLSPQPSPSTMFAETPMLPDSELDLGDAMSNFQL